MSGSSTAFPVSADVYPEVEQEYYGDHERMERQLRHSRTLLFCITLFAVVVIIANILLVSLVGKAPVHVIRINDVGRAEALAYFDDSYRPQAPEVRYFLARWARARYTRNRQTTQLEYPQNYFFLDKTLAEKLMMRDRLDNAPGALRQYLAGSGEDVSVDVTNVVVKRLSQLPYQADVYLTKTSLGSGATVTKHESVIIPVTFSINPSEVRNDLVQFNPLGLTITAFTEYQDFSSNTHNTKQEK
jgi:type IV secretory pathway component VirB8